MKTHWTLLWLRKLAIISALPLVKKSLLVMYLVLMRHLLAKLYLTSLFFHWSNKSPSEDDVSKSTITPPFCLKIILRTPYPSRSRRRNTLHLCTPCCFSPPVAGLLEGGSSATPWSLRSRRVPQPPRCTSSYVPSQRLHESNGFFCQILLNNWPLAWCAQRYFG